MQEYVETAAGNEHEELFGQHRIHLARLFATLPSYGSPAYWRVLEEPDTHFALPLEVLVKCIRASVAYRDKVGQKRIFEILFRRIATSNARWVHNVLRTSHLSLNAQTLLAHDLYADICECVIRAVIDPTRLFWEENFSHCLSYERKRVYQKFMQREERWYNDSNQSRKHTSHPSLDGIDQFEAGIGRKTRTWMVEDEVARQALLAVEQSDIPGLVIGLPDKLKAVVLLIFWEDRTEKDTAKILRITDRTVRNRLKRALLLLHQQLEIEREIQ
jgi:DNA-directed RNA polymerase specialized sigma24 family protein